MFPKDFKFVGPVPEGLICTICENPFDEPVQTSCGHLFCKPCIDTWLNETWLSAITGQQPQCPIDRKPLRREELFKDEHVRRQVRALHVFCPNNERGCGWEGCFSDATNHASTCEYSLVQCPFQTHGCDHTMMRKEIPEHIKSNMAEHLTLLAKELTNAKETISSLKEALGTAEDRINFHAFLHGFDYIWAIPAFEKQPSSIFSLPFWSRGYEWKLKVETGDNIGAFLIPESHQMGTKFRLTIFGQEPSKNITHLLDNWPEFSRGDGWGSVLLTKASLSEYLFRGTLHIGVELLSDPF
jgi:hypothetical protein